MNKTKVLPIIVLLAVVLAIAAFSSYNTNRSAVGNNSSLDQDISDLDKLSLQISEDEELNLGEIYPTDTISQLDSAESGITSLQKDIDAIGEDNLDLTDF